MSGAERTEGMPHDRLTRVADRMLATVEADREHRDGDKCIVFMDDGRRGGIGMHGYDDDAEAMTDLLIHVKAIFEANGKTLLIAPLGGDE